MPGVEKKKQKNTIRGFCCDSMVKKKNPPANAEDTGSIPDLEKIPHATEQLSQCRTIEPETREATAIKNQSIATREQPLLAATGEKSVRAAGKTQHDQK